jgi:hypothetical protein
MEAGGMVDETHVTLAVYGDDLDPDEVSSMLRRMPTHSHRKGDCKTPTAVPFPSGAWLYTVEGRAPEGPDSLVEKLLKEFPVDSSFWKPVTERFRVRIRVGVHTGGWNRGFDLAPHTIGVVSQIGVGIGFDLYLYGDESDDGV